MRRLAGAVRLGVVAALTSGSAASDVEYGWRYYRPGNTGIQGDYNGALWVGPEGDPYIGGYDPSFEEGGFAKFAQGENRWENFSNVDYPVIGHPDEQGCVRVRDIVPDAAGRLWMGTWRGALTFDPAIGADSLVRLGPGNSGLVDDFTWDIDRAPDGSMWLVNGGIVRYEPGSDSWTRWALGAEFMSVQPKAGGGYLVWSSERPPQRSYTFVFDTDTGEWTVIDVTYPNGEPGDVAGMPGKDCVDEVGNFWALRLTSPGQFDSLEYRRTDGSWVAPPEPYPGVTFDIWAFAAYGAGRAALVDGQGRVYEFDGSAWQSRGSWRDGAYAYAMDVDGSGNIWVCGTGGAARRDAATGDWQRYRVTNTSNFDSFNRDLTIDADTGAVYTGANAGAGVGGMVRFDGVRWTGWNQLTYGLGYDWPFPNDNCHALVFRPSNGRVAVSPLDWLYGIHEWTGTGFEALMQSGGAERMTEDSLGRLWALGEYYSLQYLDGAVWRSVPIAGWGAKIQPDPGRAATVWATTGNEIVRTDGTYRFSRTVSDFPELEPISDQFTGLAADRDGIVWVGSWTQNGATGGGELIRIDAGSGAYEMLQHDLGWPFPGSYVRPLAVTPDGRLWMSYDSDYPYTEVGLCSWDGNEVVSFPAPSGGEPQWGGLPHAQIEDLEVRAIPGGYELWMTCVSRGIAVLTVTRGCAADFNGDGAVNTLDVLAFLNAWTAGDAGADFNGDGAVNTLDVLAFLNAWAAGCP